MSRRTNRRTSRPTNRHDQPVNERVLMEQAIARLDRIIRRLDKRLQAPPVA